MKLIDLLKEASIMYGGAIRPLPDNLLNDIDEIFYDFGAGVSDVDLYKPAREYRDRTYYGATTDEGFEPYDENDPQYLAFQVLTRQSIGKYLSKSRILGGAPCPGAPADANYLLLEIHPPSHHSQGVNFLTVSSPHISGGNSDLPLIGWFDSRGEYIPDIKHFDKEGDPIA
jgi:hypothetical protein